MSTALVNPDNQLSVLDQLKDLSPPSKYANETALSVVTKVGDYLPYIQLFGSEAKEVKRGKFPMGHFGLVSGKNITDLGEGFINLVLAWRPKAMQFDPVEAFYDHTSPAFIALQNRALNEQNAGCGFGPEFLLWLPTQQQFATLFLGNKTGRNEAPNLIGPLKQRGAFVCRLQAQLIETKKYTWHGPKAMVSDLTIQFPTIEEIKKQLDKFNNPPKSEKEPVEAATKSDRD